MHYTASYNSPLGVILITEKDGAIVSLVFSVDSVSEDSATTPLLQLCFAWLDDYFAGKQPDPVSLPVRLQGSAFQQQVWRMLINIPYGQSVTYGQIAKQIDPKMSAQAVGAAVGHNPISIIVPCHRVIGNNNNLTGYAGGIDRKKRLLQLEGIDISKMSVPGK